jgi:hypothetical protein
MDTIEYTTFDKSNWGAGPWQHEPDKVQWADPTTGLPCLIVRNRLGALCGYVGLAQAHCFFGVAFSDVAVEVHGGLTYSNHCQIEGDEAQRVCHIPGAGESDQVWWLGFDCAHSGDQTPALDLWNTIPWVTGYPQYRDIEYVKKEVARLAVQLAAKVSLHAE